MLEIIWGILNIGILVYFTIICFKAAKIIRENLGGWATLVFVLGLLSFMEKKEEDNSFKSFNLQEEKKDTVQNYVGNSYGKDVLLEDNLATQIRARIMYGKDSTGKKLLKATASRDGFVSGTYWNPSHFLVSKLDNKDNYEYDVIGTLEWKILGIRLYTESKEFIGKIKLDQ
ncbi:MAG: hypothetical protein KA133_07435 [Flavobacterium sp.]|nr:hypothetical protein [Flavobacterium sp.]